MSKQHSQPRSSVATEAQQTRAYASWYGLWVGGLWIASFGLNIYGFTAPLASNLGLLAGLASVPLAVRLMRGFRDHVAPLPLRRAWWMAWMLFLCAALLTTASQFVYFAYLDGGRLTAAYTALIDQPEMHDMLQRLLPGQDVDAVAGQAIAAFTATPPAQLTLQFLFWNVLLASFLAFPVALFSFSRPSPGQPGGAA